MKAINKFVLKVGKLALPMSCYKVTDQTTSVRANEVTKIDGKTYKVQRKPYVVMADGTEKDIDKTQILKGYGKDDGSMAIFTKDEQSQLLKKGSSKEWDTQAIIDQNQFSELSFQKDGIVAMVEIDKKKNLLNKKNLKFFAMLKTGLENKAIVTKILYKNVEYPVAISNYQDKLLVRFLHYKDEIRKLDGEPLPKLSEKEIQQAKAFVTQFYKPKFDINSFENKTEESVMKIINSRGTNVKEVKIEELMTKEENPFATEV